MRFIALAFALTLASSVQAMPRTPLQEPQDVIIKIRKACGAGIRRLARQQRERIPEPEVIGQHAGHRRLFACAAAAEFRASCPSRSFVSKCRLLADSDLHVDQRLRRLLQDKRTRYARREIFRV